MNNQIQQYQDGGNALAIGNENGLVQVAETISSVLAAQAEAEVKARYIVAMQRPRNIERVRQALKAECERPGFAIVAFYRLPPRSKKRDAKPIQGLSIRFAESAFRAMGNLDMKAFVTYEDDDMRMVRATVIDIESNAAISTDIPIKKTIERRYLKEGEIAISQRLNSDGHVVYLRRATDDEITPKQNSAISKAFRNGVLRLLPGDIQDECERRILQIRNGDVPKDPKEQVRKIIDSFGSIGVDADDLVKYLGHKVETCSPSELQNLRDLFGSIRAGETTFHDEMKSVEVPDDNVDATPKSKPERLKDKLREKAEAIPADPPEILEIKTDCTDMAHAIWGDDGMKRISEICRGADRDCQYVEGFQKFMFSAATEEQLQWLRDELSQRS